MGGSGGRWNGGKKEGNKEENVGFGEGNTPPLGWERGEDEVKRVRGNMQKGWEGGKWIGVKREGKKGEMEG